MADFDMALALVKCADTLSDDELWGATDMMLALSSEVPDAAIGTVANAAIMLMSEIVGRDLDPEPWAIEASIQEMIEAARPFTKSQDAR